MTYSMLHGDCFDLLPTLPAGSVDAVITSPPYADQRADFYDGVSEDLYPLWTVGWTDLVLPLLKPKGNLLINIREHVRHGQIGEFVHRTRLALRTAGWLECDELIWHKPDAPPVGHVLRPRRTWERILWFARDPNPYCNPKANGAPSKRLGMTRAKDWQHSLKEGHVAGIARCTDVVQVGVGENDKTPHPAAYPVDLARWLVRLFAPPEGMVVDPFAGSGSTGLAAILEGRDFVGIEKDFDYAHFARNRMAAHSGLLVDVLGTESAPSLFDFV